MATAGQKSLSGVPEIYSELKTEKVTILLTPTARKLLNRKAETFGISRSELIERCIRLLKEEKIAAELYRKLI